MKEKSYNKIKNKKSFGKKDKKSMVLFIAPLLNIFGELHQILKMLMNRLFSYVLISVIR